MSVEIDIDKIENDSDIEKNKCNAPKFRRFRRYLP